MHYQFVTNTQQLQGNNWIDAGTKSVTTFLIQNRQTVNLISECHIHAASLHRTFATHWEAESSWVVGVISYCPGMQSVPVLGVCRFGTKKGPLMCAVGTQGGVFGIVASFSPALSQDSSTVL